MEWRTGEKPEKLASLRHLMMRDSVAGPNGTESPGGESEWTQRPTFHYLVEDVEDEQVLG